MKVLVMRSGWGGGRGWGVKVVVGGVVREVLEGGKKFGMYVIIS